MVFDYIEGICRSHDNQITVHSEEIFDVQKIKLSFQKKSMEFVYLDAIQKYFFYKKKDRRTFLEIQRLMHDNPYDVGKLLRFEGLSYSNPLDDLPYGVGRFLNAFSSVDLSSVDLSNPIHDLVNTFFLEMCSTYQISKFSFFKDLYSRDREVICDVLRTYYSCDGLPMIETSNDNIYEDLRFLMPQNISRKRAEIAEQERVKRIKLAEEEHAKKEKEAAEKRIYDALANLQKKSNAIELERTIECTYDQSLNFLASFKNGVNANTEVFFKTLDQIEKQKKSVQEIYIEGFYSSEKNNELTKKLDEIHDKLSKQASYVINQQRIYEFGSISENKIKLRMSIHKLNFTELLEMFRDYKNQEADFKRRKETAQRLLEKNSYDSYIKLYKYGEILISDRMNHLNRNPSKHKHIPQDMLDQAMRFYYDADSISAAYEMQRKEKYTQEKESGNVGESRVKEALKWLDSSYVQIQPLSKDYSGNACIYLQNLDYINAKQEYDHLLVGETGVFQIETKNFSGKLIIDQYGNWRRILQDGKEIGVKNPLEQVRKHEKVLTSFLGNSINICSIICIANDSAIIEGLENSPIPIVKSDMIVEFIEHYVSNKKILSTEEIQSCVNNIYEHMLH